MSLLRELNKLGVLRTLDDALTNTLRRLDPETSDDVLAAAASARRRELDDARAAAGAKPAATQASLTARMRQYFGLH